VIDPITGHCVRVDGPLAGCAQVAHGRVQGVFARGGRDIVLVEPTEHVVCRQIGVVLSGWLAGVVAEERLEQVNV